MGLPTDRQYTLEKDYQRQTDITGVSFVAEHLTIHPNGLIVVRAGFHFDGASFAPDGRKDPETGLPRGLFAFMVHDILYKNYPQHGITRAVIDRLMYDMLKEVNFRGAWLYFLGVSTFGGIYLRLNGR